MKKDKPPFSFWSANVQKKSRFFAFSRDVNTDRISFREGLFDIQHIFFGMFRIAVDTFIFKSK